MKNLFLSIAGIVAYSLTQAQLSAPDPVYPAHQSTVIDVNVQTAWHPSLGMPVVGYDAQIAKDTLMSNPVSLPTMGASGRASELEFGQEYWWRARGKASGSVTSPWSEASSFITFYNEFKGKSPKGPGIGIQTLLQWDTIPGVTHYQVQLANNGSFSNPSAYTIAHPTDTPMVQQQVAGLNFNSTYYYRVRAWHAKDTSGWSVVDTFSTINTIILKTPGDEAVNRDPRLALHCQNTSGVISYRFEVDFTATFDSNSTGYLSATIQDADFNNTQNIEWIVDRLKFNTNYFWRVRGIGVNSLSAWSEVREFTTIEKVSLSSPGDGAVGISPGSYLRWQPVNGASIFEVEVDDSVSFQSPYKSISTEDSVHIPLGVSAGTVYNWRVRALHSNDTSEWSNVRSFETHTIGIEERSKIKEFVFYPNPVSDLLQIKNVGYEGDYMDIKIFNSAGEMVAQLDNVSTGIGQPSEVDMSNLPSGLYLVSIRWNNNYSSLRVIKE